MVELDHPLRDGIPAELLDRAAAAVGAKARPQLWVAGKSVDRGGKTGGELCRIGRAAKGIRGVEQASARVSITSHLNRVYPSKTRRRDTLPCLAWVVLDLPRR